MAGIAAIRYVRGFLAFTGSVPKTEKSCRKKENDDRTVREIYRLRHQKAVGFNRACSRVIEQLVAQRGECTDTITHLRSCIGQVCGWVKCWLCDWAILISII